jgi:hypothetical protein
MIRNTMRAAMTAACVMNDDAASAFDGVWKAKDTGGRLFDYASRTTQSSGRFSCAASWPVAV